MSSSLLNERHAAALTYDVATDTASLVVSKAEPGGGGPSVPAPATLLLDARGFLVGVDVDPEGTARVAVMLGAHESVATTVAASVGVVRRADGEVVEVRIRPGRRLVPGQ